MRESASSERSESSTCCSGGELSVLVVDDNPVARTIIRDTVTSLGWRPDCAEGGREALEKIRANQHYDVILVDWRMPGMDGLETIRAIHTMKTHRTPVIAMVTAFDRDDVLKADGGALVDTILVKPLTGSMLYDFIAQNCKSATSPEGRIALNNIASEHLAAASILLVEDNTINQDVARRILELEHAKVTIANNGQEAIALIQNFPTAYDVVLMDIQMPVMDGYEATRIIRSSLCLPDLPIIALTAGVMASDRLKAEAAGVNDFISKPFDVDVLVSTVAKYCGRHTNERHSPLSPTTKDCPIFDADDALRRTGENRELCRNLLIRFIDQFNSITEDFRRFITARDTDKIISYIHLMRGVSGNIGARRLSQRAGEVEDVLRRNPGDFSLSDLDVLTRLAAETVIAIEKSHLLQSSALTPTPQDSDSNESVSLNDLRDLLKTNDVAAIDAFATLKSTITLRTAVQVFFCKFAQKTT